jgi:hypothetical protein
MYLGPMIAPEDERQILELSALYPEAQVRNASIGMDREFRFARAWTAAESSIHLRGMRIKEVQNPAPATIATGSQPEQLPGAGGKPPEQPAPLPNPLHDAQQTPEYFARAVRSFTQ